MLHNFPLLFVTVATTVMLVACSDSTSEDASVNQDFSGKVELTLAKEADEANPENLSNTSDTDMSETVSDIVEEVEEAETEAAQEETEVVQDEIDPTVLLAFEKIVETIGIDKKDHTFIFSETEDFIEVDVREKKASGASPWVGTYRYVLADESILMQDYLTGEFILHEEITE